MTIALSIQLIFIGIAISMGLFGLRDHYISIIFSVVMIICACLYLVWDLCCVIIPNVMDKDEFVLASLMLYMDISQIFYHLLLLLSE